MPDPDGEARLMELALKRVDDWTASQTSRNAILAMAAP
jgi:hypothetical protein